MNRSDQHWMSHAIALAQRADSAGEVPVGAIVVKDGICIGEGWNCPIGSNDPTAHAEIVALRAAGEVLGNYRLVGTSLVVTLEPCIMCIGAIIHSRVGRLVFGASDPKQGAVCSAWDLSSVQFLNQKLDWKAGVCGDRCSAILKNFFARKRCSQ